MAGDSAASERRGPREEAFGYECRRCLNCCHFKHIQLNPYEVARLARNRRLSTTDFRRRFTFQGAGVALAQTPDGACVFLGPDGCMVHPDRPLVCRLYPLGRHLSWDGSERFSHLEPHPRSAGKLTGRGVIGEYLEDQGAEPFIEAADEYMAWLNRALEHAPEAARRLDDKTLSPAAADDVDLMDMDAAIAAHQAATGEAPPADIEARKRLHLSILYDQLCSDDEEETS